MNKRLPEIKKLIESLEKLSPPDKIFEEDIEKPFGYFSSVYYANIISIIQLELEQEVTKQDKKNAEHPKVIKAKERIEELRKVYLWIKKKHRDAEVMQATIAQWRNMALELHYSNKRLLEINKELLQKSEKYFNELMDGTK